MKGLQELLDELAQQDFGTFIEAGFVAVKQLDEKSARALFRAAHILRPDSVAPSIGLGYIALNKLDLKEAETMFSYILTQEPDHYLAQVFLGITYLLLKTERQKGEQLIRNAVEKTTDPTVKHLGETSLQWMEQDLKKQLSKESSPFAPPTKRES